jgi:hypothetical protein
LVRSVCTLGLVLDTPNAPTIGAFSRLRSRGIGACRAEEAIRSSMTTMMYTLNAFSSGPQLDVDAGKQVARRQCRAGERDPTPDGGPMVRVGHIQRDVYRKCVGSWACSEDGQAGRTATPHSACPGCSGHAHREAKMRAVCAIACRGCSAQDGEGSRYWVSWNF